MNQGCAPMCRTTLRPDASRMTSNDVSRVLRRRRSNRVLAGVCGGIADFAAIDVSVVRLVIALLTVFGGAGLVIYVLGWLLIPEEGQTRSIVETKLGQSSSSA